MFLKIGESYKICLEFGLANINKNEIATRYKVRMVLDRLKVWIGSSNFAEIMDVSKIL
jgi:hypothetical protein